MRLRDTFIALASISVISFAAVAQAQPPARVDLSKPRGFVGGLLGVGFGVNGATEAGTRAYYETSLLFGVRGGLLFGGGHRHVLSFELAPTTNRIDWRLRPTTTFLASYGILVKIGSQTDWAWLPRIGAGIGGGFDYSFLVGVQLDVLTFNYKMNKNLWVDFGIPTVRFYMETSGMSRYGVQFVFPLGVTFAI